jgi:hypothetical protein
MSLEYILSNKGLGKEDESAIEEKEEETGMHWGPSINATFSQSAL